MEKENVICEYCGSELPAGSSYCNTCGKARNDTAGQVEPREKGSPQTPAEKRVGVIVILAIAVTVILSGFLYLQRNPAKEPSISEEYSILPQPKPLPSVMKEFPGTRSTYLGGAGESGESPIGEPIWMIDIGSSIIGTPLLSNGTLYVIGEKALEVSEMFGGEMYAIFNSYVFGINPENGETLWQSELLREEKIRQTELIEQDGDIYAVLFSYENKTDIPDSGLFVGDVHVFHFDSETGVEKWESSVLIEDTLLVGASVIDDTICIVTVNSYGQKDIRGIRTKWGGEIWWNLYLGQISSPSNAGGYFCFTRTDDESDELFTGSGDTSLVLLDPDTGEELFVRSIGFSEELFTPVHIDDAILCGGRWGGGRLMIEKIYPGDIESGWIWDSWLAGEEMPSDGMIVVAGKCLFLGAGGVLTFVDITDGSEIESPAREIEDIIYPPVSNGEQVFLITGDGFLSAVDSVSTEVSWTKGLPRSFIPTRDGGIAYGDGRLFITGKNGILLCLE